MPLLDSPAARARVTDAPGSPQSVGTGRGAASTPVQLSCCRPEAGGEIRAEVGTEGAERSRSLEKARTVYDAPRR
eukprot:6743912-Prymnesium_polylepis.1